MVVLHPPTYDGHHQWTVPALIIRDIYVSSQGDQKGHYVGLFVEGGNVD